MKTSGARILICDDEKLIRDLLSKALVARGFECATAEDGRDCVDQVRVQKPDVLLLDLMMPRMDGFEVIADLRSPGGPAGLKIIVLTARASQDVLQQALKAGADDFIAKPFQLAEVTSRVDAHLRIAKYSTELDRQRLDSQMLLEISQRLTSRLDLQSILNEVAQMVATVLDTDRCSIVLLDPDHSMGRVVAASDSEVQIDRRISLEGYPEIRHVASTKAALIVADIAADPLFDPVKDQLAALDVRSVALFPLFSGDRVIGVLFLRARTALDAFGDRHREFGQIVANATAIAVSNATRFGEIKAETSRLSHARELVEQRLKVVEQYQDFFESSADAMFVTDAEGVILFVNRQAELFTGLSRVLARGLPFADLVQSSDRPSAVKLLRRARDGERTPREDLRIAGPLALTASVNVSRLPGLDEALCLTMRDVTGERAVARELARTKDFLSNLIDTSVDPIVAADMDGRLLIVNQPAEGLFGLVSEQAVGKMHLSALLPEGGAASLLSQLRSTETGGVGRISPALERQVLHADGTPIEVLLAGSLVVVDGQDTAVVYVFQDQRDKIRMRNQLHQAQERLLQSERQALLAELAGTAAHELNQPLTSVLGYAELLKRRIEETDPNFKAIDTIQREATRMAEIVKRIGKITRYETKPYVGSTRIIDLAAASSDIQERPPEAERSKPER